MRIVFFALCGILYCFCAPVLGQDASNDNPPVDTAAKTDEEIVVTASRREAEIFESPFTASSLSFETLQNVKQSRTVPEAFFDDPSVLVQKTSNGQGSPFIRGFTGFRTLMLIDGIRLNNSTFREGPNQYWNTVDHFTVDRLELVKGPSSVLYGSDAIGGTVNALTRSREGYEAGFHWNARSIIRGATADQSIVERAEGSFNYGEHLGVFAGFTYKDFNDVRPGENAEGISRMKKTGYKEVDGDVKVDYYINKNHRLTLAHYQVDQDDAWRTHATVYGESWRGSTVGTDQKRVLDQSRELSYVRYQGREIAPWLQNAQVTVSLHKQYEDEHRIRANRRQEFSGTDVKTLGLSLQLESDSPVGYWTYGAEYYQDDVDSHFTSWNADGSLREMRVQGPVADDADYDLLGIYVQDEISLFDDKVDVVLGGRWTEADLDADKVLDPVTGDPTSLSDDWDQFTGSIRLLYRHSDTLHFYGGVSQGFRAPNLSDMTRLDIARTDEIETPSLDLDPEKYVSYEIGWKFRNKLFSFDAAYYYTDIDDQIVRFPTGVLIGGDAEVQKANIGDGRVHGVESTLEYRFGEQFERFRGWEAFAGFAWLEGRVDTYPTAAQIKATEPISRMLPANGILGLRWTSPDKKWWVEGHARIVNDQDRLNTADRADTQRIPPDGTPGYTTYSLRTGFNFSKNFSITFAMENITDKAYRVLGSGQNEPGRSFLLTIDLEY